MSRPRLPAAIARRGRAVCETTYEAQPRPSVVDRAHLVVDESRVEADLLHGVEVQVGDDTRRALRPRDPQTAIALQRVDQAREPARELGAARDEQQDDV